MIGAATYFPPRYFAPRYFPKTGDIIPGISDPYRPHRVSDTESRRLTVSETESRRLSVSESESRRRRASETT